MHFPTCAYSFLELSPSCSYFLSSFLDFLYPPYLLRPSPTESRRKFETAGRVENVEKVGEEVGTSRRKFENLLDLAEKFENAKV